MANTHAGLMNNSILVWEVTMKYWENLAIVSMKCSNTSSIKTMVSNFVVTMGPGHRFMKLYYETSRSCSRTRSDLFYVFRDRIVGALWSRTE